MKTIDAISKAISVYNAEWDVFSIQINNFEINHRAARRHGSDNAIYVDFQLECCKHHIEPLRVLGVIFYWQTHKKATRMNSNTEVYQVRCRFEVLQYLQAYARGNHERQLSITNDSMCIEARFPFNKMPLFYRVDNSTPNEALTAHLNRIAEIRKDVRRLLQAKKRGAKLPYELRAMNTSNN